MDRKDCKKINKNQQKSKKEKMPCQKCKTQSVYEFTNKTGLCRECFIRYFEKKILKTIRKYQMDFSRIAGDKSDVRYKILMMISGKIKISRSSESKAKTGIKNLNDFSTEIISGVMAAGFEMKNFLPKTKNKEFPLYFISDNEIMLYARLKRIKGSINRKENKMQKEINSLFSELEKSDKDVRHAVANAVMKV